VADGGSSCAGHGWSRRLVVSGLRLSSEPGQGTLAGDGRDPAVGGGVGTKWGARRRVACAGDGRSGASSESRGTSRRGRVGLRWWCGSGVKVVVGITP
jgi:hypothetical protein